MSVQPSRSEIKRRIREVERLVTELAGLPPAEIENLALDPELIDLLLETRGLKGGARKRQLKYLTKRLRDRDNRDLYQCLRRKKGKKLARDKIFHHLEFLRDSLLDEAIEARKKMQVRGEDLPDTWDSKTVGAIRTELPTVNEIELRRLSALFARNRRKRHAREIFRLLQAASLQDERRKITKPVPAKQ